MKKKALCMLAVFTMTIWGSIGLTGCALKEKVLGKSEESASYVSTTPKEEDTTGESLQEEETSLSQDEEDVEISLFKSTASVVQMEITTGLTTEYLDPLLNYPVLVVGPKGEETIEDYSQLEAMGIEKLYTPELLEAVGKADPENLQIQDGKAVLGDLNEAYVVLERDENGNTGITEFHYSK